MLDLNALLADSADRVLVMDGATGSCLEDRGIDVQNALWSSTALLTEEGLARNQELHADYVAAGAEILVANTHNLGRNACTAFLRSAARAAFELPRGVAELSGEEQAWALYRALATRALEAAGAAAGKHPVAVLAGIGGEEPWATGTSRSRESIRLSLQPAASILRELGATIVFEAVSTRPEIQAIGDVIRSLQLGGCAVGLQCGPGGTTFGGVSLQEVVAELLDCSLSLLCVQCTPLRFAEEALRQLLAAAQASSATVGIYANDGREWRDQRWHGERVNPAEYARHARRWVELGAQVVGGCCGTTPEHVAAIRELVTTPG